MEDQGCRKLKRVGLRLATTITTKIQTYAGRMPSSGAMSYHAIEALGDALDATRDLLWPFELSRWWRVALVALFVGGGASVNMPSMPGSPRGAPNATPGGPGGGGLPAPAGDELLVIGLVVLAVVLFGLVLIVIGAVMEFLAYEMLHRDPFNIRQLFRRNLTNGFRLLLFRIGLAVATIFFVGLLVGLALLPVVVDVPILTVLGLLVVVPIVASIVLMAAMINGFTTSFVVPTMLAEDRTVLSAWRRVWKLMRTDPWEVAIFLVVGLGIAVGKGVVVGIATMVGGLILLVPTAFLAAIAFGLYQVIPLLGIAVGVLTGLLFLAAGIGLIGFIKAPLVTYVRYFNVFVLGDLDDSLDLIPEQRSAVRTADNGGEPTGSHPSETRGPTDGDADNA